MRSFPVYNNYDDDQGNDYDDDDDDGSDDYVDDGDHPYYHKDENANLPATIVSIISSSKRHDCILEYMKQGALRALTFSWRPFEHLD